jgi:hypothetical protein
MGTSTPSLDNRAATTDTVAQSLIAVFALLCIATLTFGDMVGGLPMRVLIQVALATRHLNRFFSEGGVGQLEALGNALGEVASTTNRPGGRGNE